MADALTTQRSLSSAPVSFRRANVFFFSRNDQSATGNGPVSVARKRRSPALQIKASSERATLARGRCRNVLCKSTPARIVGRDASSALPQHADADAHRKRAPRRERSDSALTRPSDIDPLLTQNISQRRSLGLAQAASERNSSGKQMFKTGCLVILCTFSFSFFFFSHVETT